LVNINLLPKKLRRRAEFDWWRLIAIFVPLIVFGTIAYITLKTSGELHAKTNQRDQLRAEVQILQPYVAEFQKLERRRKELEQIAVVARKVRSTFKPWSDYLAEFLNRLPAQRGHLLVSLKSIDAHAIDPGRAKLVYGIPAQVEFSLRGEAASEKALISFVKVFETDPNFSINFQSTNFDERTKIYTFNASVGMVAKPQKTQAAKGER